MKDTIEIQIFLSSPKDVAPEKDIIKEIINSKNAVNVDTDIKYRFAALDYRDLVFNLDGSIQTVINARINEYDIYIGILWMRFGTLTGNHDPETGRPYQSGTEEEFYNAIRKKQEDSILSYYFFFKKSKELEFDNREALSQLDKVLAFKEKVKELGSIESISNDNNTVPFTNRIHAILDSTVNNLEKGKGRKLKVEFVGEAESKPGGSTIMMAQFITAAKPFPQAVPRTISPFNATDLDFKLFQDQLTTRTLISEIQEHQYIILLGNAGSGKSVELSKLTDYYSQQDSPFVPVFQRLNTYIDEPIEDFLPKNWRDIPEEIMLVIFDGLDEVSPEHFNTAIKRILNFKHQYPKSRFVVSCRTNFYDFQPDGSGPLADFEIYFLDEIKSNSLDGYLQEHHKISPDAFRKEIDDKNYHELLSQPFFLNILASTFDAKQSLPNNKAEILNGFIEQRLSFDEQHFKFSRALGKEKPHIFSLLKRLALVMEDLGRNYLTDVELKQVLTDPKDIELVKCSTAFQKFITESDKWGFEHNNIQEFLAASAIATLTTDQIKDFLTFDAGKIKPSWINTLFFLMSIVPSQVRQELIKWIGSSDPEILPKIEPDRVDPPTRLEIFKNIFNSYKERQIWLRSNKFTNRELANFAPQVAANEFLLTEISDKIAPRTSRLSAVELLSYQKLDAESLVRSKQVLISLMKELNQDVHAFNAIANALVILNAVSDTDISQFMSEFGERDNQYIRAGMYQMITAAGLVDNYIEYFIAGIGLDEEMPDREATHLIDETLLLENALRGPLKVESVKKLLQFFGTPKDRSVATYYSKHEVYGHILDISQTLFAQYPELLDLIYKNFIAFGKFHEDHLVKISCSFFNSTHTSLEVFKRLLKEQGLDDYYLAVLYKHLFSAEIIDYLMAEYHEHNFTKANLRKIYNELNWLSSTENQTVLDYFKTTLLEYAILTENQENVNRQEENKIANQANLNLYFSLGAARQEIDEFFVTHHITEINWDGLWAIRRENLKSQEPIKEFVFRFLEDFTRSGKVASKSDINAFLENKVTAERYLFQSLKHKLESNPDFQPDEEQLEKLKEWIDEELQKKDVATAISVSGESRNRFSYDKVVTACWYFISHFKIQVNREKLLDFTLFDEPNNNLDLSLNFKVITEQIDRGKVNARVLSNLKSDIQVDSVWANNVLYALNGGLISANDLILQEIANPARSLYTRSHVMKKYVEKTEDYEGVFQILDPSSEDEISWEIIEQLINRNVLRQKLVDKLSPALDIDNLEPSRRFKISRLLTRLQDDKGTGIYLDFLLQPSQSEFDFYGQTQTMNAIRKATFIPKLMELLRQSYSIDQAEDAFNRLDRLVVDALYNISQTNEVNLIAVKDALRKFITDNKGLSDNLSFYHTIIDKMDFDFYLKRSQDGYISESIKRVNGIQLSP